MNVTNGLNWLFVRMRSSVDYSESEPVCPIRALKDLVSLEQ